MSKQSYDNNVARVKLSPETSRIRLPAEVAKAWRAPETADEFACQGYFRHPGELLCLPAWGVPADSDHPFASLPGYELEEPGGPLVSALHIPSPEALLARYRFLRFPARWASTRGQGQLDLKIGTKECSRLSPGGEAMIYVVTWGVVLALYSESEFRRSQQFPLGANAV